MPGTVVITGPNGGMTVLTARQYAQAHPEDHLVLLVRNPAKLPAEAVPASDKVIYEALDMTSLDAVRKVSASIADRVKAGSLPRIKSLVCSAAIQVSTPTH
jgi:NAD(P)-dependent dehydrogenase (short-subunit alcohol dehydrogenase family)